MNEMTDKEMVISTISRYMDVLRIKQAANRDDEIENQLCELRAQLQAMGIVVDELIIR